MTFLRQLIRSFLFFLLLFKSYGSIAVNQNLPFRRISPEGGFTLSPVVELAQDKQGFVWFVTREKLYQFNSQDFISFEPKYQPGVSHTNNYITSLLIDRANSIWVGTNAGISKFNNHTWQLDAVKIADRETPGKVLYPTDIKQNSKGEIWMVESNFLARLDSSKMELVYVRNGNGRLNVNAFCFDDQDHIYAANSLGELYAVNANTLIAAPLNMDLSPIKIFGIYLINKILWISTDGYGLQRYTTEGKLIDVYFNNSQNKDLYSNRIRDVLKTSDGKIWIATYKGLIEWQEGNFNQYLTDYDNQFSLPDNSVNSLMEDRQKGLWIGTWRGGVGYLNSFANTFVTYQHSHDENSISGNLINAISEDTEGVIWIGTDGHGLDMFNEQRQIFRHIELKGNKNSLVTNIKCICCDKKGNFWLGTYNEGVFFQKLGESTFKYLILGGKNVYDMVDDGYGMWIATFGSGLYYYKYADQSIKQFVNQGVDSNVLISNNLKKLYLDASGNLWIISSLGVSIKAKDSDVFEWLPLENEVGKSPTQVYTVSGGKNGLIWLGTDHGLFSVDKSRKISQFPLYFNGTLVSVYGIVDPGTPSIWISSNSGIFSFNPVTGERLNYNVSDGLHGNLFNAGAFCQTSSGKIYFGSTTGLVAFNPSDMQVNPFKPKVYFSRIFINHKEILPGQKDSPLDKPFYELKKLRLNSGQNSFSIEFIAQNYLNPQKNQFRYRLKGFDPNWIDAGPVSKATYTNISPGEYVFEVVACNNDMVWNLEPATLTIAIDRPLFLSKIALAIYFLLFVVLGLMVRRIILYRTRLEHQIEIERLKRIEEEKSHQNKLNFFTNISHELRTPLTLITGPVETLIHSPGLDQGQFNQLSLIKRNAGRLLKLINQLLEFRKIEENKAELSVVKTDLVIFVREIFNYFIDVAKQKDINYVFVSLEDPIVLPFDAEKIDKAVFNLLSNAFKFTPDRGTIQVEISQGQKDKLVKTSPNKFVIGELNAKNYIQISVADNGPGIQPNDMEKVFDRFFRAENIKNPQSGTGIGLHLTKHLILLHEGEIELESEEGAGSVFRIRLPYADITETGQVDVMEHEDIHAPHPVHDENQSGNNDLVSYSENWISQDKTKRKSDKVVLVVEDHLDLSNFITQILTEEYRIITAQTGVEGIEKAQIYLPDLIISDVMMPGKSGFELVDELKNNLKTSHIPIILLTALTSAENKIEGFSTGADDYIEKPFNSEVLIARIKNIFAGRLALQEYYSKKIALGFETETEDSPDQKMMARAISFVEKNLTDEKLDIELLASHLNLSQSTLYRKLKALTGKSATDFIRTIRLEYAARLLKDGGNNIEEVSAKAGFNSHSYFTRSFKEHFGKTPTEYVTFH
ncbi:MAG: two-component regulator propeller domain-containing protein [Prolixibacteraceae bacterium]